MNSSAEVETSSSAFLAPVMPISPVPCEKALAPTPILRSLQDILVVLAGMDAEKINDLHSKLTNQPDGDSAEVAQADEISDDFLKTITPDGDSAEVAQADEISDDFLKKITESIKKIIQVYQDTKAKIEVVTNGLDYAYNEANHAAIEQHAEAEEERNAMLLEEDVERMMRHGRGETTDSESEPDFEGEEPARAYPEFIHQQPDPFDECTRMHEELEILEKKAERQENFLKTYLEEAEERLRTLADL